VARTCPVVDDETLGLPTQSPPNLWQPGGGSNNEQQACHKHGEDQRAAADFRAEREVSYSLPVAIWPAVVRRPSRMSGSADTWRQRHQRCCGCGPAGAAALPNCIGPDELRCAGGGFTAPADHCCGAGCCCSDSAVSRRATRCSRPEADPWLLCTCSCSKQTAASALPHVNTG
jgi:hypothetical protein